MMSVGDWLRFMRYRSRPCPTTTIPQQWRKAVRLRDELEYEWYDDKAFTMPCGRGEWMVDGTPHKRGTFCDCEHMVFAVQPNQLEGPIPGTYYGAPEHYPQYAYQYRNINNFGANVTYMSYGPIRQIAESELNRTKPWYKYYYSDFEIGNAITGLRNRVARWSFGNSGLAESLGELPETPALFHVVKKGQGVLRNATNAYLGAQFGWAPIIGLIPDVLKEIRKVRDHVAGSAKRQSGPRVLVFKKPFRNAMAETVIHQSSQQWPSLIDTAQSVDTTARNQSAELKYLVICDVKPKWAGAQDLLTHLASLDGIPSLRTAWELIPRSFLIDYFIKVGDFISALQGNLLYDIDVKSEAWSISAKGQLATCWKTGGSIRAMTTAQYRYYYRSTLVPNQYIQLSIPSTRVLPTSFALLAQRFLPLPRGRRLPYKVANKWYHDNIVGCVDYGLVRNPNLPRGTFRTR